jgi:hypothetical protein
MANHDYVIANQTGANTRSDLNSAFSAIVSNNSSSSEPATTYAYMWWADTTNDLLKQRNAANSAWIDILTLSTGAPSAGGGIASLAADTTPQLGGDLDVNGNSIVSASNADIAITPNGTGNVVVDGIKHPQADGTSGQLLQTDGAGQLSFADAAGGGAWTLIGTQDISTSVSSITQTGLDGTYDAYVVILSGMVAAGNGARGEIQLGDSAGIDGGVSDYTWVHFEGDNGAGPNRRSDLADDAIEISEASVGVNGTLEGLNSTIWINQSSNSGTYTKIHFQTVSDHETDYVAITSGGGRRNTNLALDRVRFRFGSSNNTVLGRMSVYGISHT